MALGTLPQLDASQLKITRSQNLRDVPAYGSPESLTQSVCTDHMVTARWTCTGGWESPEVKPSESLSIPPTASCLHYATQCFEGLKVYRGYDGKLRLFRPDLNGARLATSAARISLPTFPPLELKKLIDALLKIDGPRWLPKDQPGRYLYLRPAMIGSGPQLGVTAPREALLFIIALPWPDMSGGRSLKLLASKSDTARAWPGGFGHAKLGANYGPSLVAHSQAQAGGFDQVLWLFGANRQVTEAGASNFFVVWTNKETGKRELVTAGLDDKVILPGITRRSIIEVAKARLSETKDGLEAVEVVERQFTMGDLVAAYQEGRLLEAFVAGTAFFVTPVAVIVEPESNVKIELADGNYTATIKSWLEAIQYGKVEDEWAYVIEEEGKN